MDDGSSEGISQAVLEADKPKEGSDEFIAEVYLKDLGLTWDVLKGKKILDMGAGPAKFAREAKKRGIEVVSVDKIPGGMGEVGVPKDVPYIVGDILNLPVPDNSFDVVVSRAVAHALDSREELAKFVSEAKRVLKSGGELRFGPGYLGTIIFAKEGAFAGEDEEPRTSEWEERRFAKIAQLSLQLLQSIDPAITLNHGNPANEKYRDTFYALKKV